MREQFIGRITKDNAQRLAIQMQLEKLNQNDAYYIASLFQNEHIKPPGWFYMIYLLSVLNLLLLIGSFLFPQFILGMVIICTVNLGFHYWNKRNVYQYLASIPQLLRLNGVAKELFKNDQLKAFSPKLQASINVLNGLRNRMSLFKLESNLGGEMQAIAWAILEFIKILFLLEPILLFNVLKRLSTKKEEIENVFDFVGNIDALISIASLRKGLKNYCFPNIGVDPVIDVREMYHPLVLDCVRNSLEVTNKSILLTGSNMSGKTTFIRSVGINSLTALTITALRQVFLFPG